MDYDQSGEELRGLYEDLRESETEAERFDLEMLGDITSDIGDIMAMAHNFK